MRDQIKMKRQRISVFAVIVSGVLAACAEEPTPPTIMEFMENPVLLDATLVRCGQNRAETRYDGECINARDAVDRLAVAAELVRREELKAQSERKQAALRRAREEAAAAQQRVLELERLREEAEYLSQFSAPPEPLDAAVTEGAAVDVAVEDADMPPGDAEPLAAGPAEPPAESKPDLEKSDLETVRQELQQRSQ